AIHTWTTVLYERWEHYNWAYLKNAMSTPQIVIAGGGRRLGQWEAQLRTIIINADHFRDDPWPQVMETLRHEMAHQYVTEILRVDNEPTHGAAWRRACEKLRVSPQATCSVHAPATEDPEAAESARLMDKVRKLMALGSSPNEHEASAAMTKARELLTS